MDDEHRGQVDETLQSMHVIEAAERTDDAVPLGILSDVIAARRVVRISYAGEIAGNGLDPAASTVRDVETMGLLRAADSWLLIGWCRLRHAIRGFHIDRITHLDILDEVAPTRDPSLLEQDLSRWTTRRLG